MKIISLQAENVKRLVAVEIRPDGNIVEICGKNGQGKTSVLDSIWWALGGSKGIQAAPIRRGANEARIRLDLGELIVTRQFWRAKDGQEESTISVEGADGSYYGSPQTMLNKLIGALSFDPLAFARMKPAEQFNTLRKFVPEVDFDKLARADKGDRERRKGLNQLAEQERAAALAITVPQGTPEALIDEAALVAELAEAGDHNAEIETRRGRRERLVERIATLRMEAQGAKQRSDDRLKGLFAKHETTIADLQQQIDALQARIERTKLQYQVDHAAIVKEENDKARAATAEADESQAKLDAAGPLPEPKDATALTIQINQARVTNANVGKLQDRAKHVKRAEEIESQADTLTRQIEQRQAGKEAAIAAAKMPVEGLGFGEEEVLLKGLPINQASSAEQLDISCDIAFATAGELRVAMIREGSLLDEDSMRRIAEKAANRDVQVWIERVDGSGKVGFILEDGHVRRAAPAEQPIAQEATA